MSEPSRHRESLSTLTDDPIIERHRILVVGMRPPRLPLRDGYVLHLYHVLNELHLNHEVTFVAVDDGGAPFDDIDGLPVTVTSTADLKSTLQATIRSTRPQVIHAVGAPLARVLGTLDPSIPKVLGALDAPHLNVDAVQTRSVTQRMRKNARRWLSLRAIRTQYGRADRVVVVSDEDGTALREVKSDLAVSVIPNGVDLAGFGPRPDIARQPDRLLFTGALNYPPNVATAVFLCEEVMPHILENRPATRLSLVGRDPGERVNKLGAMPGIDLVGPVEDMGDALATGSVYVCPMVSGTGIKNKLLEALANGLPCVASPLAIRGTSLSNGTDVLVGETATDVADLALRLLADEDLRRRMSSAGRAYVEDHHSWSSVAKRFDEVYTELISAAGPG